MTTYKKSESGWTWFFSITGLMIGTSIGVTFRAIFDLIMK